MGDEKTILLIEDDDDTLELLTSFLVEKNFLVDTVTDGVSALKYLETSTPDLIITDLLLRGEHGMNVVKEIKQKYFLPVIIISGIYHQKEMHQFVEQYSVEGFFEKPLDLNLLESRILTLVYE